jgi:hypothetical protein
MRSGPPRRPALRSQAGLVSTVSLIMRGGVSPSVRTSVSNRSPVTRISLNAGGLLRTRFDKVPAPIILTVRPARSTGTSKGS